MDRIQTLLDERIEHELEWLDVGCTEEEKSRAIENLSALHKLRIEEMKIETERNEQKNQSVIHNLDRWIDIGVRVGLTIIPLIAYNAWYNRGLRFEETGSIGSPMVRNLTSRLLPKK